MTRSPLRPRILAAFAASAALAGCAAGGGGFGGTQVHSVIIETNFTPSEVGGAMPVAVWGAPPDGAAPEAVAAQMRLPQVHGGRPMALTASSTVRGPRVVVVFGGGSRREVCLGGGRGVAQSGPPMTALVAYCFNDVLSSSAILRSTSTLGPSDAAFAPAMLQAVREILPGRNPALDPSSRRWLRR